MRCAECNSIVKLGNYAVRPSPDLSRLCPAHDSHASCGIVRVVVVCAGGAGPRRQVLLQTPLSTALCPQWQLSRVRRRPNPYCRFRSLSSLTFAGLFSAFDGQQDPKTKWLESMASGMEGQGNSFTPLPSSQRIPDGHPSPLLGKELRRVQSHVVSRPQPARNTETLLRYCPSLTSSVSLLIRAACKHREAEDQYSPSQQARKSLNPGMLTRA